MDSFNEFLLLEMTNEMDFIRQFFINFKNFNYFDSQTLLVFADWLKEHDDPKEELVRICAAVNNLEPDTAGGKRGRCAQRLGINSQIIAHTSWVAMEDYTYFYYRGDEPGYGKRPQYVMGMGDGWYMGTTSDVRSAGMLKVNISSIPDADLRIFFWDLLGYGWGYGVNDNDTQEIEMNVDDF
jgi:uncharacterized protein (TIGR02996 family)